MSSSTRHQFKAAHLAHFVFVLYYSVADPGFPVGGTPTSLGGGVPTPDMATFHKICMSKRKNRDSGSATVTNITKCYKCCKVTSTTNIRLAALNLRVFYCIGHFIVHQYPLPKCH